MTPLFGTSFIVVLFWLVVGHALADYPWQGDFLAQAKNPTLPLGKQFWRWALPMHGFIHGSMVALVTGSVTLGIIEVILHCTIDWLKCQQRISFNTDQTLHLVCKVIYALGMFAAV